MEKLPMKPECSCAGCQEAFAYKARIAKLELDLQQAAEARDRAVAEASRHARRSLELEDQLRAAR